MTVATIHAQVVKPANGGVSLFVTVRGPDDEVRGSAGDSEARRVAALHGWDPDGRARSGWPSSYGIGTSERTYSFDQCLCHHVYGCKIVTADVVWDGICGEGPELVR